MEPLEWPQRRGAQPYRFSGFSPKCLWIWWPGWHYGIGRQSLPSPPTIEGFLRGVQPRLPQPGHGYLQHGFNGQWLGIYGISFPALGAGRLHRRYFLRRQCLFYWGGKKAQRQAFPQFYRAGFTCTKGPQCSCYQRNVRSGGQQLLQLFLGLPKWGKTQCPSAKHPPAIGRIAPRLANSGKNPPDYRYRLPNRAQWYHGPGLVSGPRPTPQLLPPLAQLHPKRSGC